MSKFTESTVVRTIDAKGKVLGRLATEIAVILRGKDKPTFTPNLISGDRVVVVNAAQIAVTGKKLDQKMYYRHTGYIGGLKTTNLATLMARHPERVIEYAVAGMLPRNRMKQQLMKRLTIFAGNAPSENAGKEIA